MAVKIREEVVLPNDVLQIINGDRKRKAMQSIKIDAALYKKYFKEIRISNVTEIIEHALECFRMNNE